MEDEDEYYNRAYDPPVPLENPLPTAPKWWTGSGPSGAETLATSNSLQNAVQSPYEKRLQQILDDPSLGIHDRELAKSFARSVLGITLDNQGPVGGTIQDLLSSGFGHAGGVGGQALGVNTKGGFLPYYGSSATSANEARSAQNVGMPQISR